MLDFKMDLSFWSFLAIWVAGFLVFRYLSIVKVELIVHKKVIEFKWVKRPFWVYQNLDSIKLTEIKKVVCANSPRAIHFVLKHSKGRFHIFNYSGDNYYEVYNQLKIKGVPGETEKEQRENFKKFFKKKRKT